MALATCKVMPGILVNKVVDKKRKFGKRGLQEEERHTGSLTKKYDRLRIPKSNLYPVQNESSVM
jgi:hypothetical protein